MNPCKPVSSALVVIGGLLTLSTTAGATIVTGGNTTVALDAATVGALTGLGFGISPISPSTLTGLDAVFPITGGNTTTAIYHSGGLAFTKGGITTDISDFTINLLTDKITGNVNTATGSTTTFFDIGAGDVLKLDATLAGALVSIYGIPNLTGADIGTATINATLAPEPATGALSGLAALAAVFILTRNRRRAQQIA
jgi:hypothetical protein